MTHHLIFISIISHVKQILMKLSDLHIHWFMASPQGQHGVSPGRNGCTFVIGMVGLGAAGDWGSTGLAEVFSDGGSAVKLPRGLTFSVLGVSTVGRSSSVTETTSILEGSSALGSLTGEYEGQRLDSNLTDTNTHSSICSSHCNTV